MLTTEKTKKLEGTVGKESEPEDKGTDGHVRCTMMGYVRRKGTGLTEGDEGKRHVG